MAKKKQKPDVTEISTRLLEQGRAAADEFMFQYPMDRDGDDILTFRPTAWHRLRETYMAGFAAGSGKGFREGLLAKKGI